jgi:hypothetical protein
VQVGSKPLTQATLCLSIKIDKHIAAENRVELCMDRPGVIHEIDTPKRDQLPQFRSHPHGALVSTSPTEKILLTELANTFVSISEARILMSQLFSLPTSSLTEMANE